MRVFRTIARTILCLILLLSVLPGTASAVPTAEFRFVENALGDGSFRYDYTLFNTSDPVADAGFNIFDVSLFFDPGKMVTVTGLPVGWNDSDGGGFVEFFSLNPGPPPDGNDVSPGASLAGFVLKFDFQAGNLPFEVLFTNPEDQDSPALFAGTTSPLGPPPMPGPSSLILIALGLAGSGVVAWTRQRGK